MISSRKRSKNRNKIRSSRMKSSKPKTQRKRRKNRSRSAFSELCSETRSKISAFSMRMLRRRNSRKKKLK